MTQRRPTDSDAPAGRRSTGDAPAGRERRTRAQVGIGTLVIFIAMILIAAITAGVLFETTSIFETQTEETSDETSNQITDQLEVVAITGSNITTTTPHRIERVEVIVTGSPGGGSIDLRNVSVQWLDDEGFTLVHENGSGGSGTSEFTAEAYVDTDDTFPVVTNTDDRYALVFEPGVTFGEGIEEGERVQLVLMTPSGATKSVGFQAPDQLANTTSVEL